MNVPGIGVRASPRGLHREADDGSVPVPAEARHHAERQLRSGQLAPRGRVHEVNRAHALLVGRVGERSAVERQVDVLDVGRVGGEELDLLRREVHARQPLKLRSPIRRHVQAPAVPREEGIQVGDLLLAARGQLGLRPRRDVDEPQVRLVDRDRLDDEQLRVVGRPVGDLPAAALELDDPSIGLGVLRILDVHVDVVAVAPRRAVGDRGARVRPAGAGVARSAVRQERHAAVGEVVAVELEELAAAHVLREDEGVSRLRVELRAGDAVGEERQLGARAAGEQDAVGLGHVAEARRDEHLVAGRMPGGEAGRAEVRVPADLLRERRRNRRHALDDEVLVGFDVVRLGAGDAGDCKKDDGGESSSHGVLLIDAMRGSTSPMPLAPAGARGGSQGLQSPTGYSVGPTGSQSARSPPTCTQPERYQRTTSPLRLSLFIQGEKSTGQLPSPWPSSISLAW